MAKVSVLVVDDAPFIRDLVKKALRSHFPGLQIEEATNGRKAQQVLSRATFDLILCDWEMPEMNGLELLKWYRAQPDAQSVPFIMVTSRGDKENVVEAIQAGVSDYIGKPFSNEQLIAKVKKSLQRSGKLALLQGGGAKPASSGGSDSLANLTAGRKLEPDPKPAPRAHPLINQTADDEETAVAGVEAVRGQAQLRLPGQTFACVIKTLSLRDALVIVRRAELLPQVFASGVLDLEQDTDKSVARINVYVHAVAALEAKMDSEWLRVTLKFVDQDPEKLNYLSRLIASGTAQQHYSPGA